jgi:formylglycine-generating enzyme required for sulfatase activity
MFNNEHPPHDAEITEPFYMSKFEVTIEQFRKFVTDTDYQTDAERHGGVGWNDATKQYGGSTRLTWKSPGFAQLDSHPVVLISYNDAVAFCNWLSRKHKYTYTLPSEKQWEFSCRAGTITQYSSGNSKLALAKMANLADDGVLPWARQWQDPFPRTAPVGSFAANAFGLHDMHGNVYEWCSDIYTLYQQPALINEVRRVTRGGAWESRPEMARSAVRLPRNPTWCCDATGFRVVLVPQAQAPQRPPAP